MSTIYLDAAASAPLCREAFEAMTRELRSPGNPGGVHQLAREARRVVEESRDRVADLMRCGPAAITFTASATEANNLAIFGVPAANGGRRILTSKLEHPSVLQAAHRAGEVRFASVLPTGELDLVSLADRLDDSIDIVSVQAANNETGVIQPLAEIAGLTRDYRAVLHVDASQLMAWGPCPELDNCDLVTISSHKMHGPQGAAALVARQPTRGHLVPQTVGGGQERGLRSGTENVAALAGFGAAAQLAVASGAREIERVTGLRNSLLTGLRRNTGAVTEHGGGASRRLPGILNVAFGAEWPDGPDAEALLARTPSVAASTGSACNEGAPDGSPVLRAMGIADTESNRSIRFSLSRMTTEADISRAVQAVSRSYRTLVELIDGPRIVIERSSV